MHPKRAALLAAPFVLVGIASRLLVPRWGDAIARDVRDVVALVPRVAPRAPEADPPPDTAPPAGGVPAAPDADAGALPDAQAKPGTPMAKAPREAGAPGRRLAVHVPAAAVQRAMDDGGTHIKGRTVRGPDGKPAGVKLMGVSGAHLGLQDGDVIVSVDGRPTMDDDTATEIALAAIGRGASTLHAVVLRGDQPIDVTLDLPLEPAGGGDPRKNAN
jgi:hypothetical protein